MTHLNLCRLKTELRALWTSGSLWGGRAAALLLVCFAVFINVSLVNKSMTADEIVHIMGGYTYWQNNDYRINPENGNLPQRVAGLPLLALQLKSPVLDQVNWSESSEWALSYGWFYGSGNDATLMLVLARAACSLIAVALGGLVWWWSRELFGAPGAMVSLLLYVFSPSILANGALATSDTASAMSFLVATYLFWRLLDRVTLTRALLSGCATGLLFISKMSGPLVIAVYLLLCCVRFARRVPLRAGGVWGRACGPKPPNWRTLSAALVLHVAVAWSVVWAAYGFRYDIFAQPTSADRLSTPWEDVLGRPSAAEVLRQVQLSPDQGAALGRYEVDWGTWYDQTRLAYEDVRNRILREEQRVLADRILNSRPSSLIITCIGIARTYKLLPEGFLYGYAYTWKSIASRNAFLNGEVRASGWLHFFPYTVLVKTPLPVFALCATAIYMLLRRRWGHWSRQAMFYRTAPLWALMAVYWSVAVLSHINIGHRHILTTYPPLFVLCGAVIGCRTLIWSQFCQFGKWRVLGVTGVVLLMMGEVLYRFPHYLAYFSPIAGGPASGYRHLVDSSLDWGQELPAVGDFVQKHGGDTIYLSYFGNGSPQYEGISCRKLCSFSGWLYVLTPSVQVFSTDRAYSEPAVSRQLSLSPEYDSETVSIQEGGVDTLVAMLKKRKHLGLEAGWYLISATMLQSVLYPSVDGPYGPWRAEYEAEYQRLYTLVRPLLHATDEVRGAAFRSKPPTEWRTILEKFDCFRFGRITAFLRRRKPDGNINYGILVYEVSPSEITAMLDGPAPLPDVTLTSR